MIDDTAGYPSDVVSRLFGDVQGLNPRPSFVVSTGDYLFASQPRAGEPTQASPQLDIYLQARASFAGPLFLPWAITSAPGPPAPTAAPALSTA